MYKDEIIKRLHFLEMIDTKKLAEDIQKCVDLYMRNPTDKNKDDLTVACFLMTIKRSIELVGVSETMASFLKKDFPIVDFKQSAS